MSETTVPMDDKELWNAATEAEPAQAETVEQEQPEVGQPRDEHGRFATKAQEPEQEPVGQAPVAQEPEPKEQGIPSWRLKEEAEARRAAEARLEEFNRREWQREQELAQLRQQLQQATQPQEQVDPYADLPGAIKQATSPFEGRLSSFESKMVLRASRAEAVVEHGREAVSEMETAIQKAMQSGDPEMQLLSMQMRASDHPVGLAMKWHQNHKLVTQTGGDIESYKAKLLEDPEFLNRALEAARLKAGNQQKPSSVVSLPPSLNKAAASMPVGNEDNDMSDGSLWRFATAR